MYLNKETSAIYQECKTTQSLSQTEDGQDKTQNKKEIKINQTWYLYFVWFLNIFNWSFLFCTNIFIVEAPAIFFHISLYLQTDILFIQPNHALYSRSAAELDGGEGPGGTVGVVEQLLDRDADGDDSDRVGVGLIEHGAQTLDGLGLSQRGLHGVHRLWSDQRLNLITKLQF